MSVNVKLLPEVNNAIIMSYRVVRGYYKPVIGESRRRCEQIIPTWLDDDILTRDGKIFRRNAPNIGNVGMWDALRVELSRNLYRFYVGLAFKLVNFLRTEYIRTRSSHFK